MPVIYIDYSRNMDVTAIAKTMAALAHPVRLAVLRELGQEPEGLSAGELARRLVIRQNTLSSHIAALEQQGLIFGHRHGRYIIYRSDPVIIQSVLNSVRALSTAA
jgi:DNA-binding transcriptional ArsR family regulator